MSQTMHCHRVCTMHLCLAVTRHCCELSKKSRRIFSCQNLLQFPGRIFCCGRSVHSHFGNFVCFLPFHAITSSTAIIFLTHTYRYTQTPPSSQFFTYYFSCGFLCSSPLCKRSASLPFLPTAVTLLLKDSHNSLKIFWAGSKFKWQPKTAQVIGSLTSWTQVYSDLNDKSCSVGKRAIESELT